MLRTIDIPQGKQLGSKVLTERKEKVSKLIGFSSTAIAKKCQKSLLTSELEFSILEESCFNVAHTP